MSNIGYIVLAIVIIVIILIIMKDKSIIVRNIGRLIKTIIMVVLILLLVIVIRKLLMDNSDIMPAPFINENSDYDDSEDVDTEDDDSKTESDNYRIIIRGNEVEILNSLMGDISYSVTYTSKEAVLEELQRISSKQNVTINIIDDYADFQMYDYIVNELMSLGVPEEKIVHTKRNNEK